MLESTQSPLTAKLNSVKQEKQILISQRNYLAVRDLRLRCIDEVAEEKKVEEEKLRVEQALERERLEKAHLVMQEKTRQAANRNVDEITQRFNAQTQLHAARQARQLAQYEAQVRTEVNRVPLVYSSTVRDLLAAEEHLVKLGLYEEAAQTKRKIGAHAEKERAQFKADQLHRIEVRVAQRKRVVDDAEAYMQLRLRNEISMAKHRAVEKQRLLDESFRHSADDMAHAHRLEMRKNPLLHSLQCPPAMRRKKELASRSSSSTATGMNAVRGTQALSTAVGSRYEVPSLCDSYSELVSSESCALPRCASRSSVNIRANADGSMSDSTSFFAPDLSVRSARGTTAPAMPSTLVASDLGTMKYGLVRGAADHDAGDVY